MSCCKSHYLASCCIAAVRFMEIGSSIFIVFNTNYLGIINIFEGFIINYALLGVSNEERNPEDVVVRVNGHRKCIARVFTWRSAPTGIPKDPIFVSNHGAAQNPILVWPLQELFITTQMLLHLFCICDEKIQPLVSGTVPMTFGHLESLWFSPSDHVKSCRLWQQSSLINTCSSVPSYTFFSLLLHRSPILKPTLLKRRKQSPQAPLLIVCLSYIFQSLRWASSMDLLAWNEIKFLWQWRELWLVDWCFKWKHFWCKKVTFCSDRDMSTNAKLIAKRAWSGYLTRGVPCANE